MIPLILIGVIVSGALIPWWLLKDDSVISDTDKKDDLKRTRVYDEIGRLIS